MTVPREAAEIRDWLRARVAEAVGTEPREIGTDEPLATLGLASRDLVALSGELEEWLGQELSPTLVWEFPTIDRLAGALAEGAPP